MRKNHIKTDCKKYNSNNTENFVLLGMLGTTLLSGALLALPSVLADDGTVTDVAITVPVACSITSTTDSAHTASVDSGTYKDNIGKTTIKATCNDSQGFSIYAIGYTNEEYGNTVLKPSTLDSPQNDIATGTATNGDTSSWAMKLTASTGMSSTNILSDTDGTYSNYHKVPTTYTKVATMASVTDATVGASLETTYSAYIAGDQPADIYTGKVKYTMVHPASEEPLQPKSTASGQICYYANASSALGTMGCQDVASEVTLLASNFSREGYGFAGWSDKFDYATNNEAKFYGPNETIALTPSDYQSPNKGLSLYAVWVKSQGNLQDTTKVASVCSELDTAPTDGTANLSSVSALTDQRDNNTYAIAKLADGKCWMIENLRLESTAEHNTDGTLAQGYHSSFAGLANAESEHFSGNDTTANSLYSIDGSTARAIDSTGGNLGYRFPRYNNTNTSVRASAPTYDNISIYSYGNYYTWHAAIADTTYYDSGDHGTTSLCPTGWRLPIGAKSTAGRSFGALSVALGGPAGGATANSSSTPTGPVMSRVFRSYPNNFLYSGEFDNSEVYSRGISGKYWSSTTKYDKLSSFLDFNSAIVLPGTNNYDKNYGFSIRCVSSS